MPGKYFDTKAARFIDNYHQADLICVGNTLDAAINCVGFDNGSPDPMIRLVLTPPPAGDGAGAGAGGCAPLADRCPTASYTFVRGSCGPAAAGVACEAPQTPGPWPCSVVKRAPLRHDMAAAVQS